MAARVPNYFVNPVDNNTYAWDLNHDEEEAIGRSRNIEHSANTGQTGLVRQQGSPDPVLLKISGTILKLTQLQWFWGFYAVCESNTIHYQDFTGARYEVLITDFQPKKVRAAANPRGGSDAPLWYWKYTMTMEVISFVSGPTPAFQTP